MKSLIYLVPLYSYDNGHYNVDDNDFDDGDDACLFVLPFPFYDRVNRQ